MVIRQPLPAMNAVVDGERVESMTKEKLMSERDCFQLHHDLQDPMAISTQMIQP
jgi:hypothetical protein